MTISINNWRLDPSLNALVHVETGEIQRLGEFHYILLEILIKHAGEVLPRTMLINEVWKNRVVGNNSLPTAIYALRVALGDDGKQQEIIKTIPKKGYQFSKEFIVVHEDDATPLTTDSEVLPEKAATGLTASPFEETPAQSDSSSPSGADALRQKNFRVNARLMAFLIGLAIVIAASLFFFTGRESSQPGASDSNLVMTEISQPYTQTIKIYHLQHKTAERVETGLSSQAPVLLKSLNTLLSARKATLTLYYYASVQKLSVDLLVKNQCQTEYQLMMNIHNWVPDRVKLDQLLNQEVERTLNEMPDCH